MCLTVPCQVVRVDGATALVARNGAQFEVSLFLLDREVRPGDWLAVQAQREARAVLSAKEAEDILALYAQLSEMLERGESVHAGTGPVPQPRI